MKALPSESERRKGPQKMERRKQSKSSGVAVLTFSIQLGSECWRKVTNELRLIEECLENIERKRKKLASQRVDLPKINPSPPLPSISQSSSPSKEAVSFIYCLPPETGCPAPPTLASAPDPPPPTIN